MKILIYLTDIVIQIQPRRKGEYCISVDMAALPSHTEHFSALDGGLLILLYAHRRGGALGNAFGAFRHKQDLHRSKTDAKILDDAGVGYVHQIHFQLVVGPGVVLAVDLRVAGEAGLGLQAQPELRHCLLVLCCDLGPLRTGADNGQVALQDVHQLGQLVDARLADNASHRRNAVIVLAGGQAGHAVLLRVHPHTAEFMDLKDLPVPGQTVLRVKDRAAVVGLDGH